MVFVFSPVVKRIWGQVQYSHNFRGIKGYQFAFAIDRHIERKINFEYLIYFSEIYAKFNDPMQRTSEQYDAVITNCRDLFTKKMKDYGCSWRILRLPSLTDQIFIKAQRIRSLQENKTRKVDEGEVSEFIGIINYSAMALIQLEEGIAEQPDFSEEKALARYDHVIAETKELMQNKNHDYGEAWREMRISSLTDMILTKLLRVKSIENNNGITEASEGVAANYQDMLNYAVFALILLK